MRGGGRGLADWKRLYGTRAGLGHSGLKRLVRNSPEHWGTPD